MPEAVAPRAVIAIASNKGGVGKTTVASNLAIYLRALQEDLPVLLLGLDDQSVLDRMFRLRTPVPGEGNLKHGWAERSLDRVLQLGQYGVHFVPTPPDTALLKARADDPRTLGRILERTEWPGAVIIDTKSDLEALTQNALHAADRIVLPVSDRASLEEAEKVFRLLERARIPRQRAKLLFTLVDRRSRVVRDGPDLQQRLEAEVASRGLPHYRTRLSRSPRLEALNSATHNPGSILHHAAGTRIHDEMRDLTEELMTEVGLEGDRAGTKPERDVPRPRAPGSGSIKRVLLGGLRRR